MLLFAALLAVSTQAMLLPFPATSGEVSSLTDSAMVVALDFTCSGAEGVVVLTPTLPFIIDNVSTAAPVDRAGVLKRRDFVPQPPTPDSSPVKIAPTHPV